MATLTPRQIEVLRLLATGLPRPEIAARLGIAEGTLSRHIEAARARMGARNSAHLVALAYVSGLISP